MSTNRTIREEEILPFHEKVYESANKLANYFVLGYFALGFVLAPIYNSWWLAAIMGSVSLGAYYGVKYLVRNNTLFHLVTSLVFWNFPLQFLLQMHGSYIMMFFYFVSLTVLLFYESRWVLAPTIAYAFFSFIFLFFLKEDVMSMGINLEEIESLGLGSALHLGIMALYAALCLLWAKIQRDQTREAAISYIQMNEQVSLMDVNIQFANQISQGNLTAGYPNDHPDKLGNSLLEMQSSLREAAEREKKEKFVNVGLASVSEILRNHVEDLDELSDKVIEKLVNYMKANQGGLFILEEENDGSKVITLKACRAYDRKKFLNKTIAVGEGLIGQIALEKETLVMTEIPEGYLNITSGLGIASPSSLVIVPLKSNEEVVGLIEMASFKEFNDTDIEFLEKVGESIASTILSAKTNQQTKELLEGSRQMTEELHAQEEEMRQNMEEMQATQEEMARTQKELSEKEANLKALINNTDDSIITIDRNYRILVMNDVVKRRYKGTQFEGMGEGSNALEMLGDVADEWKGYYDKVMENGEHLNFVLESSVQGEQMWREYFLNPIRSDNNLIIGCSVFSRDISDKIRAQRELAHEKTLFQALLDFIPDHLYYKDLSSKFLKVSKSMLGAFDATTEDELIGKSDFDFFDKSHAQVAYDNEQEIIRSRQAIVGNIEREIHKDGTETWAETTKMPLFDDNGEVMGTIGITKNITESKQLEREAVYKSDVLRSMVDNTPDAIFTFDKEYRIVVANKHIEEHFNRDGISNTPGTRLPATNGWKEHYDRALSGDRFEIIEEAEFSGVKKSFRYLIGPVLDEENNIIGGTVISREVEGSLAPAGAGGSTKKRK